MRGGAEALLRHTVRTPFIVTRDAFVGRLERHHHIRTSGIVELEQLGIAAPERMRYKPAPWTTLRRALPARTVTVDDVFLDLGSGMGRIVFQAALSYRFKRVIGVELSSELHGVAQDNIDRNRHRLECKDVVLVRSDVLDYDIPDDVSVVFLDNPFVGGIFDAVLTRLLASVDRAPRAVRIVYFNPAEHERLMATGRVSLVKRVRGMRPGAEWSRSNSTHVYRLLPRPGDPGPAS